jgi:hypothetical protein
LCAQERFLLSHHDSFALLFPILVFHLSRRDPLVLLAASNQGDRRRNLLGSSKKGHKNNQAAQSIDQSKFFGGGINQGQAGKLKRIGFLSSFCEAACGPFLLQSHIPVSW